MANQDHATKVPRGNGNETMELAGPSTIGSRPQEREQQLQQPSISTASALLPNVPITQSIRMPISPPTPAPSPRPHAGQRGQLFQLGYRSSSSASGAPSVGAGEVGASSTAGDIHTSSTNSISDPDHTVYSDLDQDDLDGMVPSMHPELLGNLASPTSWPPDPQALTRAATALLPTLSSSARVTLLSDLLLLLSSSELAQISSFVSSRLRIDFLSALPIEISLHILSFIDDPLTLARASQVNRFWRSLVNDEHTWEAMCLKYRYRYRRPSTVYPREAGSHSQNNSVGPSTTSNADLLASLYRRYRERGLDPSNARDELRTLHDLFLAKQSANSNALGTTTAASGSSSAGPSSSSGVTTSLMEMSNADLRFYEQLEQIVQEESRARYGLGQGAAHELVLERQVEQSVEQSTASGTVLGSSNVGTSSGRAGWLSAGPASSLFPRAAAVARSRLSPLTGVGANATFDSSRSHLGSPTNQSVASSRTSGLGLPWGLSDLISLPTALGVGGSISHSLGLAFSRDESTHTNASAEIPSPNAATLFTEPRSTRFSSDHLRSRSGLSPGHPSARSPALTGSPGATTAPGSMHGSPAVTPRAARFAGIPLSEGNRPLANFEDSQTFSYKAHFKRNYLTESNWHRGGRLLTHHISTESGSVCTCLAMDQRWLVIGMANGKIHLFEARTGLFKRTLQGRHDSGVWCLALVSRTKGARKQKSKQSEKASSRGASDRKGKGRADCQSRGSHGSAYSFQEAGVDGNQEYLTLKKDLRLVRHDPRLTARVNGTKKHKTGKSDASGAPPGPNMDDQTLMWFHRARQALNSRLHQNRNGAVKANHSHEDAAAVRSQADFCESSASQQRGTTGGLPRDIVEAGSDFLAESLLNEAKQSQGVEERQHFAQHIDSLKTQIDQIRQNHGITGYRRTLRPAMRLGASSADDTEMSEASVDVGHADLDAVMAAIDAQDEERAESTESDFDDGDSEGEYEGFSMGVGGTAHGFGTLCSSTGGFGNGDTLLVSGGCDRELKVWDLETGELKFKLRGHHSTVRCLRVLEGRPIAISGGRDATVRVWDIETGKEIRVLAGHQNSVRCMEVAGNRVATGSYDCTCRIWDVNTGECLHVLRGHYNQIYCIGFDGNKVATGSLDSTVRVWSAETGEPLALLQGHTALVGQLQLTNNMLISGGSDGRIIAYSLDPNHSRNVAPNAKSGQSTAIGQISGFRGRSSANSSGNASSAAATARNSFTLLYAICAHDNSVSCLQFDEHFILTGGNDGTVRLWNLYDGSFVRELVKPTAGIWKLAFRNDKVVWVAKQDDESLSLGVVDFKPVETKAGQGDRGGDAHEARAIPLDSPYDALPSRPEDFGPQMPVDSGIGASRARRVVRRVFDR